MKLFKLLNVIPICYTYHLYIIDIDEIELSYF